MFLSQLFQCYAFRPQQPSWVIPQAQCFVLPSGLYGWTSVWCPQPCLLPWPTTWICGRPTRPWLAMPWTRSLWISCCPPASTSNWTSHERPQSSTSSWWVLLCIIKTASPSHRHYPLAVLTGWLLWSGGSIFFGSTSRSGLTNRWWRHYVCSQSSSENTYFILEVHRISQWERRLVPHYFRHSFNALNCVYQTNKSIITMCRGSISKAFMTPGN